MENRYSVFLALDRSLVARGQVILRSLTSTGTLTATADDGIKAVGRGRIAAATFPGGAFTFQID